ncbi:hypothetical protein Tco_0618574 [Tanacetum coccineum]
MLTEHLTRKRNRRANEVGGSGSVVVGEELNPSSTPYVPLDVTPLMIVYPISDYDDEEVVETASVEVDVVSGSYFINTIEIKINVVGGLMKLVVKNMKNVVECVK